MAREFVSITVPVDRVDEVYSLLARSPAKAGRPEVAEDDDSVVSRAYRQTSDTMRRFLDVLARKPGQFVTGGEMERSLGLTQAQFRGHLGGFTRLWYGPLKQPEGSTWFFEASPRGQGGTYEYRATDEVAAQIQSAKEEYEKRERR